MTPKTVLCVGFGNMGCRHVQSLLDIMPKLKIIVAETDSKIFQTNLIKISGQNFGITQIKSLDDLPTDVDFAIVATSSHPRFEIVKKLLQKGIKKFLLEKVVFQSENQFNEIIKLLNTFNAQAYCNFVNRYYPNYLEIRARLQEKDLPITMVVSGGDFGLGCNALHYVDLFEFITGKPLTLISHELRKNENGNKRGPSYKEVIGQLLWTTASGDTLAVSSEITRIGGIEVLICQGESVDVLNEQEMIHLHASPKLGIIKSKFLIQYTSTLTKIIYNDILANKTQLPTVEETKNNHIQLFLAVNQSLGLSNSEVCPIT